MQRKGEKNTKTEHDEQEAPNTMHCKTTSTCKCADINCNRKPLTQGHLKLPCNRPSTVTQTLAKTLEHRITASSPIKTLTKTNAMPTPR